MADESTPAVGAEDRRALSSGDLRPEYEIEPEEWSYRQKRRGNSDRLYAGRVVRIGGAEGERLRADLTAAIADLLVWAADHERRGGCSDE